VLDLMKMKENPTDDDLKGVTVGDVARAQVGLITMVKDHKKQIEDGGRSRTESETEFKGRLSDLGKMVDALKEQRTIDPDAHLTQRMGDYAARAGGLFQKGALLPYGELLGISTKSSIVRGSDAERLADIHDAQDAYVLKFALECYAARTPDNPHMLSQVIAKVAESTDFKRLRKLSDSSGYTKANEVIHPMSGGVVNPLTMSLVSGSVLDLVRMSLSVANQFPEVPMANFDMKLPVNRGDGIGVRGGSSVLSPPPKDAITSPIPASNHFGTIAFGTVNLVAEDVLAYLWWSDRAVVDSVVPLLPYLRNQIAFMHARAIDRACMSGDIKGRTTGLHDDDWNNDFPLPDARHLWNGLRTIGSNNITDNAAAALDAEDVRLMLKRMRVYGLNKASLRLWMNTGPLYDMLGDSDVKTAFQGQGNAAPVINGELGRIYGVPMLPTEWIPTDLDATTHFSVSGGVKTAAVLANVDRFVLGVMGPTMIETTRMAPMLTTIIQATGRFDFAPMEAIDGAEEFASTTAGLPLDILADLPS